MARQRQAAEAPREAEVPGAAECNAVAVGDLLVMRLPESRQSLRASIEAVADQFSRVDFPVAIPALFRKGSAEERAIARVAEAVHSTTRFDTEDGWGPEVSDEEAAELERANLQLQVDQRREQLAVSFSRVQVADMLGISPQTVSDWVAHHRIIGLKHGREWRFPAWQFTPDSADPVLPELGRLVDAFPGGVVSLSRWMNRPNDNLEGRTPAQEMVRDSDRVFAVVESLTAA